MNATMALITLATTIAAPCERVFDLARSIDLHRTSMEASEERAIAGVKIGLIGLDQDVTWQARHLGVTQRLTVKINRLSRPVHFQELKNG